MYIPDVQTFRASIGEYSMKVFVHIIYTANPFVTADSPKWAVTIELAILRPFLVSFR